MKDNLYTVSGTTYCTGCKEQFFHVVIHPDFQDSKWCMLCFGERFGIDLMNKQREYKLNRFAFQDFQNGKKVGVHSYAELWEYSVEHFPNVCSTPINKLKLEDYNRLKNTPDYINDIRDEDLR